MELLGLIILLVIFAEVTILVAKSGKKPLINNAGRRKIYVDTSALMDSRLIPIMQTGFIADDLIIARSVTNELQLLADGKDPDRRARARAAMDSVRELERVEYINVSILEDALDRTPVDNRLMDLAKANGGMILSNDYNLKKVAEIERIEVLNINELALVLRNKYFPGERARIRVAHAGNNPSQGIGYLDDGVMVIIDNGSTFVGQEVDVEFSKLNQSATGTIMFAKMLGKKGKR